jgi:endonuclease YncB( thermonuclease family)
MPVEPVEILWSPAGATMDDLGAKALVDVTDGDTPNFRMPIRMLSVDTPEVTAQTAEGAAAVDAKFAELVGWIRAGKAPIASALAAHLLPKLADRAGTRQFDQGNAASAWSKSNIQRRLALPDGRQRKLFIRLSDTPFDANKRLLAYVAPSFSETERATLSRQERATFNLDLIESGWGAPFVLFPSIPGELDLPLYLHAAVEAMAQHRGQYADPLSLFGYEYRMCEKLYAVTRKLVRGEPVKPDERFGWRTRYAVDMRTRRILGPESYMLIPPPYRLWIWPQDVRRAIAELNLIPSV